MSERMADELPYEVEVRFACDLCWETFASPVALLEHEAQEDDQLYDFGMDDE